MKPTATFRPATVYFGIMFQFSLFSYNLVSDNERFPLDVEGMQLAQFVIEWLVDYV